ncbi:MAG: MotA/TolQ/ExbB proton channel family protein [Bdellovibrionales bacterium]|nr:MotA/TolQ/ExbB proton channel family protein [Bdellovibrionales bacterium]
MPTFFQFLKEHFAHVFPVMLAGVFGVAIIFERAKALFVQYPLKNSKEFFEQVAELVLAGKTPEAVKYCDKNSEKPVAQIVKSALSRAHLPIESVEQGVSLTLSELTQDIQKRTPFLATISNVATLLGLFGTISGLIFSFEAVGHADPQQKSALLSAGIATAMNATMIGLAVAIPCMIAYSILVSKSNKILGDMEEAASRSVDMLKLRMYAGDIEETSAQNNNVTNLRKVA